MSRMKLGLFGTVRTNETGATGNQSDARDAAMRDRLTGLTPIELAAVEAMSRTSGPVSALR